MLILRRFLISIALALSSAAADADDCIPVALLETLPNPAPHPLDDFGYAVGLSGNRVIIGAFGTDSGFLDDSGTAYIMSATTGTLIATLNNPTPGESDEFARSVALSGNVALVGAHRDNPDGIDYGGSAYLFDATTAALLHTLNSPLAGRGTDRFGGSVAISGGLAIVGAAARGTPYGIGSAYLFDVATGAMTFTLNNPQPSGDDSFGAAVDVTDSLAIVGAYAEDPGGITNGGAAYVFDAVTGALLSTLTRPSPAVSDHFGEDVAISGDLAVVGAPFTDYDGFMSGGTAYVFNATTGTLLTTLNNPEPDDFDQFGHSVAISGNVVVVSSHLDEVSGIQGAGTAYVFNATTGGLLGTINNPDPSDSDTFGASVDLSSDKAVVGAFLDHTGGEYSGTVYTFTCGTPSPTPTVSPTPSLSPTPTPTPSPTPEPTFNPTLCKPRLIKEIVPGPTGDGGYRHWQLGDKVIFTASTAALGEELYVTDGTSQGTSFLKDIYPGPNSSDVGGPIIGLTEAIVFKNRLYFRADKESEVELWSTDGTPAGTRRVVDVISRGFSYPEYFTIMNDRLYFSSYQDGLGSGIYVTDGTVTGTHENLIVYQPRDLETSGGLLYYTANNGSGVGEEVYVTSGNGSASLVGDIYPGSFSSGPGDLTAFNGAILFTALSPIEGPKVIWKGQGAGSATEVSRGRQPKEMTVMGNRFYFQGNTPVDSERELFVSDGTPQGTVVLHDLGSGAAGSHPHDLFVDGNQLYFQADLTAPPFDNIVLWRTDGTPGGLQLVKDFDPTDPIWPQGEVVEMFKASNGYIYMTVYTSSSGYELWRTDGTTAGTVPIPELVPGPGSSAVQVIGDLGNGGLVARGITPETGMALFFIPFLCENCAIDWAGYE